MFVTSSNLDTRVRMDLTNHGLEMVGLLPIPKWVETNDKIVPALNAQLMHLCLAHIFEPLIKASENGVMLSDAFGAVRRFVPLLSYYSVDQPEAVTLAGVMGSSSPVTTATRTEFGDREPHPIRNSQDTQRKMEQIKAIVDPATDMEGFALLSNSEGLSGVEKPFWLGWRYANMGTALTYDLLHSSFKFCADHIRPWCAAAMEDQ